MHCGIAPVFQKAKEAVRTRGASTSEPQHSRERGTGMEAQVMEATGRVAWSPKATMPQAVVLADMDGTLRDPDKWLERETVRFLRGLVGARVMVIPASGRTVETLITLCGAAEVDCPVFCGENGAHIRHRLYGKWDDEFEVGMRRILEEAERHLRECAACGGGEQEAKRLLFTVHYDSVEEAAEKAASWRAHLLPVLEGAVVLTHPDGALDLVPRGMSKASAVRFVAKRFPGVPIIAAGDGENDDPMFQSISGATVTPVCPGNAHPNVVRTVLANGGRQFDGVCAEGTMEGIRWALAHRGVTISV